MKKIKLNAKPVGATSSRPNFEEITLKNNPKGITLIALIITIIVMLVLVGVTINVALNGGLFEKGEKAAYQTNIATIKEMLALKKAEILADNNGRTPDKYNIGIGDIGLSQKLEDEFKDKLTISEDGTLYYIDEEVNEKEKTWLEELGITKGTGGTQEGKILTYRMVDGKGVALKLVGGMDEETKKEKIENALSAVLGKTFDFNDSKVWINIANAIAIEAGDTSTSFSTEDSTVNEQTLLAIEYINKILLQLPETQSEEDTIASLIIFTADRITVNGIEYNMLDSGYLIKVNGEEATEIKVVFEELNEKVIVNEDKREGFGFDTWYVYETELSKKYIKFSQVGNRKIMYSYSLGDGRNIEEKDVSSWTWNDEEITVSYTGIDKESSELLQQEITAELEYKWVGNNIVFTENYFLATGEKYGPIETLYTKAVTQPGEEYPFKFCYFISSGIGGIGVNYENLLNYDEFDKIENRYVEVNGTYSFKFELKQGKHMSVNVRMNDNELSESQYSFTNNLLVIPNITGPVKLNITIY